MESLDREVYSELVRRHARQVFGLCHATLKDAHAAEDVAQQALMQGFLPRGNLRDKNLFLPWIRRIAMRLCIDFLRRRKLERARPIVEEFADDPVEEDESEAIQEAIFKLPRSLRTPIVLYYLQGRSVKGIAEMLEIKEAAVHLRLCRARQQLRAILSRPGKALSEGSQ